MLQSVETAMFRVMAVMQLHFCHVELKNFPVHKASFNILLISVLRFPGLSVRFFGIELCGQRACPGVYRLDRISDWKGLLKMIWYLRPANLSQTLQINCVETLFRSLKLFVRCLRV